MAIDVCIADTLKKDVNGNPAPRKSRVQQLRASLCGLITAFAKIVSRYSDLVYPVCGKARKIRRQWTITDWCTKKTQWYYNGSGLSIIHRQL